MERNNISPVWDKIRVDLKTLSELTLSKEHSSLISYLSNSKDEKLKINSALLSKKFGKSNSNLLHVLAIKNEFQVLEALAKENAIKPFVVNQTNGDGITPLYAAVAMGNLESTKILLQQKIKAFTWIDKPSLLHTAVLSKNLKVVKEVLYFKPELVHELHLDAYFPVDYFYSCEEQNEEVKGLIAQMLTLMKKEEIQSTSLVHLCISNDNEFILRAAISMNDLLASSIDKQGQKPPLYFCCLGKFWKPSTRSPTFYPSILVAAGADLHWQNDYENFLTKCFHMNSINTFEIAKFLIENGADVKRNPKHGDTVLSACVGNNDVEKMKYLLTFFEDDLSSLNLFNSYFSKVVEHRRKNEMIELLIKYKCRYPNARHRTDRNVYTYYCYVLDGVLRGGPDLPDLRLAVKYSDDFGEFSSYGRTRTPDSFLMLLQLLERDVFSLHAIFKGKDLSVKRNLEVTYPARENSSFNPYTVRCYSCQKFKRCVSYSPGQGNRYFCEECLYVKQENIDAREIARRMIKPGLYNLLSYMRELPEDGTDFDRRPMNIEALRNAKIDSNILDLCNSNRKDFLEILQVC